MPGLWLSRSTMGEQTRARACAHAFMTIWLCTCVAFCLRVSLRLALRMPLFNKNSACSGRASIEAGSSCIHGKETETRARVCEQAQEEVQ